MKGHIVTVHTDKDGQFYGKCQCPWSSGFPHQNHRWEVDDLARRHHAVVERARASLRRGGTLASEMAHAADRIADPATSEQDRRLWQILYDGYHSRIGERIAVEDGLW